MSWHHLRNVHFSTDDMKIINRLTEINGVFIKPQLVMGCLIMKFQIGAESVKFVCGKLFTNKGPADTRDLLAAMLMSVPGASKKISDIYEYLPPKINKVNIPKLIEQLDKSFIMKGEELVERIGKGEWNPHYGTMPEVLKNIELEGSYINVRGSGY